MDEQKTRRSTNQMGVSMGMTAGRAVRARACTHVCVCVWWVRIQNEPQMTLLVDNPPDLFVEGNLSCQVVLEHLLEI